MAAKAGQLMLELGDPQRLGLDQRDQALGGLTQLGRILGQRLGLAQHGRSISQQLDRGNPAIELSTSICYKNQPVVSGRQVRCGARQSMPSSSIDSCAGVTDTRP